MGFEIARHIFYFSERMGEQIEEEFIMNEFNMKGEKASIKGNSSTLTPVEDISTVYVKEEDVKMEGIIRNNKRMIEKYI